MKKPRDIGAFFMFVNGATTRYTNIFHHHRQA